MIDKIRKHWKWIAAAIVVLGILSSEGVRTYWQRKKALRQLEKRLEELRQSNKTASMEIERLKNDPNAIEQVARRDLGLIQPGEIEYRFVVDHSSPSK